ncbi:MAG: GNAT family N-acetyltransferase [Bacillus sp. (in: firmicutes)]
MIIRKGKGDDNVRVARLMEQVDHSGFMLFNPGERKVDEKQIRSQLEKWEKEDNCCVWVAEEGDSLVGYLFVIGGRGERNRHTGYIVIGIEGQMRGKGIGTSLFTAMEKWAAAKDLHRLELTVIEHNEAAKSLYRKMGFEEEGVKKDSLFVDGAYVNEIYMSKLIG